MLEEIFQGFVEWGYGLVLECWEYFSSVLLDMMSMDFAYLKTHIPVIDTIMQLMLGIGWALLLGNLVFQALKSMISGLGFEGEDPKLLFTRTFVFAFLLMASPQICEIGLNITQTIIDILQVPDAVNITFADDASFGGLAAAWILVVICGVIVMFKVLGLIIEMAERYIILALLTITAPLAFGMGGSRNTSDIFTGWCRMFGSMCFVMVMNVVFFKMLLSVLSFYPSGLDVLPWMLLVLGIVKVAKKIDAIVTRIGLNPAITGDSLGRTPGMLTYAVIRAATRRVVQTAGKNAGGGARGTSPKTPPGGGPRTGSGGYYGNRTQHAGQTAGTQNASRQDTSKQQSGTQSVGQNASDAFHSATRSNTAQQEPSAWQSSPWAAEQPGSTRPGAESRAKMNSGFGNQAAKRSAVPPGTRRAASHIRQTNSGIAGISGTPKTGQAGQRASSTYGTAGTTASGMRAQSGGSAQSPGGASSARAGSRFVQSVQQSAHDGDVSTVQHANQQQNISVGVPAQGQQHDSGTAGTRYTAHSASMPKNTSAGTAGTGTFQSQQATGKSPATARQSSAFSAATGASVRHGRNAAQTVASAPPPAKAVAEQRTVRQEGPTTMGGAAPRAPGTAGMNGRVSGVGPQNRSSVQPYERVRSNPRPAVAADSGKMASAATAQQEKAQSSRRQSNRKQQGGAERGKR